jgi:hypothetical protein
VETKGGSALPALQAVAVRDTAKMAPTTGSDHEYRGKLAGQSASEKIDGAEVRISAEGAADTDAAGLSNLEFGDQSGGF